MLKSQLLHPHILSALGKAGHGSKVLIADGNYPHWTAKGPNARVVYLNLAPGMVGVTDVLKVLLSAIPVEAAAVMAVNKQGPYVLPEDPPIWNEFRALLREAGDITQIERFAFYKEAGSADVCLTVATGEQRIYANLLLTIGVVK